MEYGKRKTFGRAFCKKCLTKSSKKLFRKIKIGLKAKTMMVMAKAWTSISSILSNLPVTLWGISILELERHLRVPCSEGTKMRKAKENKIMTSIKKRIRCVFLRFLLRT